MAAVDRFGAKSAQAKAKKATLVKATKRVRAAARSARKARLALTQARARLAGAEAAVVTECAQPQLP